MFEEITPLSEAWQMSENDCAIWQKAIDKKNFLWVTVKLSAMYKGNEIANYYHGCNLLTSGKQYFKYDHLWRNAMDQLMPDVLNFFANANNLK